MKQYHVTQDNPQTPLWVFLTEKWGDLWETRTLFQENYVTVIFLCFDCHKPNSTPPHCNAGRDLSNKEPQQIKPKLCTSSAYYWGKSVFSVIGVI